jgi:protein-tyrosine-phosphatase
MIRRVLLVCSGNTCRSPMAMTLLRHLWQKANPGWDLEVHSAGTGAFPGMPASEHAVAVMKARGLDLSDHRAQVLPDLQDYDLVLTMTRSHRDAILARQPSMAGRVFTLGEYAGTGHDVPDPFGGPLSAYEQTASALEPMLQAVVDRIRTEGRASR